MESAARIRPPCTSTASSTSGSTSASARVAWTMVCCSRPTKEGRLRTINPRNRPHQSAFRCVGCGFAGPADAIATGKIAVGRLSARRTRDLDQRYLQAPPVKGAVDSRRPVSRTKRPSGAGCAGRSDTNSVGGVAETCDARPFGASGVRGA